MDAGLNARIIAQEAELEAASIQFQQAIQTGQPADVRANLQALFEDATHTFNELIKERTAQIIERTAQIIERSRERRALHEREIALIEERTAAAVANAGKLHSYLWSSHSKTNAAVVANAAEKKFAAEIADHIIVRSLRPIRNHLRVDLRNIQARINVARTAANRTDVSMASSGSQQTDVSIPSATIWMSE
ncbi:hypothetical protein BC830DRAFT_24633 [Chytriomyces sp. MP71]|nr:hypothetical protein BC830DRAFT_24633 [Chytriomyces sp. MP71]